MAHLIDSMAFVGDTPWHGLGNQLTPRQPIEVWARQAGMDWTIEASPVRYLAGQSSLGDTQGSGYFNQMLKHPKQDIIMPFDDHKVLYRSDTHAPLSVVSQRYHVVYAKAVPLIRAW